jgi:hypothetical protein
MSRRHRLLHMHACSLAPAAGVAIPHKPAPDLESNLGMALDFAKLRLG